VLFFVSRRVNQQGLRVWRERNELIGPVDSFARVLKGDLTCENVVESFRNCNRGIRGVLFCIDSRKRTDDASLTSGQVCSGAFANSDFSSYTLR
jgi:hypothetical protein